MLPFAAIFCLSSPASGQWTLKDGTSVMAEFFLPSKKQAWRTNGTVTSAATIYRDLLQKKLALQGYLDKIEGPALIVWTTPKLHAGLIPNVRLKLSSTKQADFPLTALAENGRSWINVTPILGDQAAIQNVAIGVADGAWKTAGWVVFENGAVGFRTLRQGGIPFKPSVTDALAGKNSPSGKAYTALAVQTPNSLAEAAVSYVVKDRKGHEMTGAGYERPNGVTGISRFFYDGDFRSVGRVEIRTRKFEWTTIRDTHFVPK